MNSARFVASTIHTAAAAPILKKTSGASGPCANNAYASDRADPRGIDIDIAEDVLQTQESTLRALLDDAHAQLRDARQALEAMKAFVISLTPKVRAGGGL